MKRDEKGKMGSKSPPLPSRPFLSLPSSAPLFGLLSRPCFNFLQTGQRLRKEYLSTPPNPACLACANLPKWTFVKLQPFAELSKRRPLPPSLPPSRLECKFACDEKGMLRLHCADRHSANSKPDFTGSPKGDAVGRKYLSHVPRPKKRPRMKMEIKFLVDRSDLRTLHSILVERLHVALTSWSTTVEY